MSIGDVNSNERGTGARFNDGKAPYDMLPLGLLHEWMADTLQLDEPDHPAQSVLSHLGRWQAGDNEALDHALLETCASPVDLQSFAEAARVFQHVTTRPVKPYPKWNWMKGMPWSVPLGCAIRHALAWLGGEELDPETGLPHLGHLQCNLLMLMFFREHYPEGDDRPKGLFEAPATSTARQLYDETSAIAAAQDGIPAESAYLLKNGSRIATPAEVDGLREVLTAEELKGFGIGDIEPRAVAKPATTVATSRHPMAAEAIRDHDERLDGPEDRL